mmetsp:Transcript_55904/g.116964  ORF Transcript_55904/g.116964 Transcript_55904/m.116964 type:complete len:80 (-) Transcript_55904:1361-1600(-)
MNSLHASGVEGGGYLITVTRMLTRTERLAKLTFLQKLSRHNVFCKRKITNPTTRSSIPNYPKDLSPVYVYRSSAIGSLT